MTDKCCDFCDEPITISKIFFVCNKCGPELFTLGAESLGAFQDPYYTHLWEDVCEVCSKNFEKLTYTQNMGVNFIFPQYKIDPKNVKEYANFAIACETKKLKKLLTENDIEKTNNHLKDIGVLTTI
jgi:hypothetical protein